MEPTKSSSRNIYDNVLACEDLLDKMLLVLPQNREHEWNEIQDYIEDFKRWAEDLGFHTSAGPRFDKCIYPNSNIHEVVLRLLRVLRRNANFGTYPTIGYDFVGILLNNTASIDGVVTQGRYITTQGPQSK